MQLIRAFVFAQRKIRFSHDMAHVCLEKELTVYLHVYEPKFVKRSLNDEVMKIFSYNLDIMCSIIADVVKYAPL